jgi:NAD(P)-dependent dehydrogenase (short-subunit alcohol dehydrogenase family)
MNESDLTRSIVAVRGIFRGLRHRSSGLNCRVNLIAPSWVETPLTQSTMSDLIAYKAISARRPGFAGVDQVVEAMVRCATDGAAGGKAFAVYPQGYVDLGDDEEGGWAADHMRSVAQRQRPKKETKL